jgi:hypothetical protein
VTLQAGTCGWSVSIRTSDVVTPPANVSVFHIQRKRRDVVSSISLTEMKPITSPALSNIRLLKYLHYAFAQVDKSEGELEGMK